MTPEDAVKTNQLEVLELRLESLMTYLLSLPQTTENYLARVRLVESYMWAQSGIKKGESEVVRTHAHNDLLARIEKLEAKP